MRRAFVIAVGALLAALAPMTAARADDTVVVRGLGFAAGSTTNLAILGCPGIYDRSAAPVATYLSPSPGGPAGTRALRYQLTGDTAVGSQHRVGSMAATTVAGLSVLAPQGTSGVAYAGYQSPEDAGTTLVWIGRAPLAVAAGAWQLVDATGLTYTWTKYDFTTQAPVAADGGTGTVADFMAGHGGDGPGFYALGFGCDGHLFKIDALRTGGADGVTTYDLEGYTTATGITGSATRISAGDALTIQGSVTTDMVGPLAQGLLLLEQQEFGKPGFEPVDGAALQVSGGDASATLHPSTQTVYRWRFAGSSSADGSVSPVFTVDVAAVVTAAPQTDADGTIAIVGLATPARAGLPATLWQVGPDGPVRLASAPTGADGGYRIALPADVAGPVHYFVTVPAGDGNLAGQSPTQTVTVTAP